MPLKNPKAKIHRSDLFPISFFVVFTQEEHDREMRRMRVGDTAGGWPGSAGFVREFESNGGCCHLVMVGLDEQQLAKMTKPQIIGILAHEAMHVLQMGLEFIGENYPGRETEAYLIQWVVEMLYGEWEKRCQN